VAVNVDNPFFLIGLEQDFRRGPKAALFRRFVDPLERPRIDGIKTDVETDQFLAPV
jgi:hypothetical protein